MDWVKGRASRAMKDGKADMAGSGRVERFEEQSRAGGRCGLQVLLGCQRWGTRCLAVEAADLWKSAMRPRQNSCSPWSAATAGFDVTLCPADMTNLELAHAQRRQ